jgi:hypothetical protein
MENVKINTSKTLTLTLPSDPIGDDVFVDLYSEYGDLLQEDLEATRVSAGVYTITFGQNNAGIYVLNSVGVHQAVFKYVVSGEDYSQSKYFNVYTQYVDSDSFFEENPELIDRHEDIFDLYEARVRNIIDTYCGQSFGSLNNKHFFVDGNNHKNLHLPFPISTLRKVTLNPGEGSEEILHDSSDSSINNIEKIRQHGNFESSYYLRFKVNTVTTENSRLFSRNFREGGVYKVEGDFGWRYVPDNVKQAAILLIADLMNDDSEYRRHRITNISMDTTSFSMPGDFYETTGNIEADVLLMDYMLFIMDYII